MTVFMGGFALGVLMRHWLDDRKRKDGQIVIKDASGNTRISIKGRPTQTYFIREYVQFEVDD